MSLMFWLGFSHSIHLFQVSITETSKRTKTNRSEYCLSDHHQIFLPLKYSENHRFPDNCRGNRCLLIFLYLFDTRNEVWR